MASPRSLRLAAIAGLAFSFLLFPLSLARSEAPRELSTYQDGEPAEVQLAVKYAPRLYIGGTSASCFGSAAAQRPLPVEAVLDNPRVVLRLAGASFAESAPGASGIFLKPGGYYLDYPGDPTSPNCTYDNDYQSLARQYAPVAYARIATEPGFSSLSLQYWFFYYFNDWNNKHEGDWEGIELIFAASDPAHALAQQPVSVTYTQHSRGQRAKWTSKLLHKDGDHPIVYVAAGSNSNQMSRGTFIGKGEQGSGFGCDDTTQAKTLVEPVVVFVPGENDGGPSIAPWQYYGGQWGEKARGENDGPTGPNTTLMWQRPISWSEEQTASALHLPGDTTVGGGVGLFCNLVRYGSTLYLRTSGAPLFREGLLVALAAAFGWVGWALFRARETERRIPLDSPAFFRAPRRFGGLLFASIRLYHRYWPAFLLVSVVFVPIGLLLADLQSLVFRIPFIGALLDVADSRRVSLLLAVLYGTSASLPVTLFVTAGIIAVIGQAERRRRLSAANAYRTLVRSALPLLGAQLRAIAIVAMLALSIVGLPWAINRLVRWFFIEQAVLLDGARAEAAAGRSSSAVSGRWWRTLFITSASAAFASFVPPLVASLVFVATSLPIDFVNFLGSIVYVIVLPLVGIALTLYYRERIPPATADAPPGR